MKKRFLISFLSLFFISIIVIGSDDDIWIGLTKERKLFKNLPWFKELFNSYEPQAEVVQKLKERSITNYKILAFGGTWCSDTKKLLPKFYKTTHSAGLKPKNITLYFLDKELRSPSGIEKKYQVISIPTFIMFKDGKEIGRVVEKEFTTIEEDLLRIIESKR